jgi:hypothetical protein
VKQIRVAGAGRTGQGCQAPARREAKTAGGSETAFNVSELPGVRAFYVKEKTPMKADIGLNPCN